MDANFREAFESQGPALLRYLRRLTGSRSDAEEIVQDTFLKLHCQRSAGAEILNVRAWLFRVGTNAARDLERERRVRAREEANAVASVRVIDFEEHLQRQQLTRRALLTLPRRMRQVLLLWADGFSYREIAEITGIEPGYVGVLLQRARAAFRSAYEHAGEVMQPERKRDGLL